MALQHTFGGVTQAETGWLDDNFADVGALGIIPCTITGTDTLTLTPNANTPTVSAYANYQRFAGIAVNTNTGPTTARVGALASRNVYFDGGSGPAALGGGEIVQDNIVTFAFDSALNSGTGGFHLLLSLPPSEFLDLIDNTVGSILSRTTSWGGVTPGNTLQLLTGGNTISWSSISTILDNNFGSTVGGLITRGPSAWQAITPGASGTVLTSQGAGSIPAWV